MLKVFLVEDEIIVREGIKNNINWREVGIQTAIGAAIGAVVGGVVGGISYTPSGLSRAAVNKAVNSTLKDANKMNHIMQPKHNLPKSIKEVGKLMKKTLIKGEIVPYKSVSSAVWSVANSQVTFLIVDGLIRISDMWVI